MNTHCKTNPIPVEEIARAFESDVASADMFRAAGLTSLQRLLAARANHAEREQARLASELGETHPQVLQLKGEIAGDRGFVRELAAEIVRVQTPAVAVDKQGWVLHGHVRNEELEGQPGLTVALFDRVGRWVEILGHACTDRRGYFQLRYQRSTDAGSDADRRAMAAAASQRLELFIRISNQKQELLYRDKTPVTVTPGQAEYREIILGCECASCTPPPAAPTEGSPAPSTRKTRSSTPAEKPQKNRPPR